MDKVVEKAIAKMEEFQPIPMEMDWNVIYNIPNYLFHTPFGKSPPLGIDEETEEMKKDPTIHAISLLFREYLNAMDENKRLEMVKDMFMCSSPFPRWRCVDVNLFNLFLPFSTVANAI